MIVLWKLSLLMCLCSLGFAEEDVVKPRYVTPKATGDVYMQEPFDSDDAIDSWIISEAKKDDVDSDIAKYDGKWKVESAKENALDGDLALVLKSKARHHAIAAALDRPFVFDDKPFVMQYEVNFQNGIECGGAYVKLLSQANDLSLEKFQDKTNYTIMFGPDKCGEDYKLHFIFRHKNPKTEDFEEKHAKKPTADVKSYYTDKATHLYTLVVNPDNTFQIYIDQTEVNSGNLLNDFNPPVNPPAEIEDKNDKKPEDWDERETIPDPEATKPDDWDEDAPAQIPDPDAEMPDGWLEDEPLYVDDPDAAKPEDWDDEMDGEWEAPKIDNPKCKEASGCGTWEPPMISNPAYKGKWRPPMINNPDYKGIWKPRMIPNPDYFEDKQPYKMTPIAAIGFELWSMSEDILFDNILITSEKSVADEYAEKTWKLKNSIRKENENKKRLMHQLEEEKRKKENRKKSRKQKNKRKRKRKSSKRLKLKPGFFKGLLNAAEERPWLWIIYVLVVGLPIIILTACCCGGSKKDGDHKKTDEPTPDDPHDDADEETKEEDGDAGATENDGGDSQPEESKDEDGAGSQAEDAEEEAAGEGKKLTKADLEKDEEGTGDDDSGLVRRSPRKRKQRVQE